MAANRTNIRLNKTLLILLGILLACLLTLNAKSLYTADLLSTPTKAPEVNTSPSKTLIDKIGMISFTTFHKKISSLKK